MSTNGVRVLRQFDPAKVGPVCQAFMASNAYISIIQGPVGSAKTTACLMKAFDVANRQQPGPDGVRRTKGGIVRDTYRNLTRTTIPSWWKWVPKSVPEWRGGSGGDPASHTITWPHADGRTTVEMIVEFIALDGQSIEDVMSGWEGTWIYFEEVNLLDEAALIFGLQRVGRYPGGAGQRCTWYGVWASLNAPSVTNWVFRNLISPIMANRYDAMLNERLKPAGLTVDDLLGAGIHGAMARYFRQPGAFEPGAENLKNLPPTYYAAMLASMPDENERNRKIHNRFGPDRRGKPVFESFNDTLHVASSPIEPTPDVPLVIGADAGLTPAAVIMQQQPDGQVRILDELVLDRASAREFGEALNRLLRQRYPGFAWSGWGDPAANAADPLENRGTWLQMVSTVTGRTWRPAPSNSPAVRLEAVNDCLRRLIDGRPAFLLSPRCEALREGFNSGYRYRKMQTPGDDRYDDKPEKNKFSHVHDALQYAVLGGGEHLEVLGRRRARAQGTAPVVAQTGFDVWGGR